MKKNTAFIAACLDQLAVEIGERPVGGLNNQRAEKFISETFRTSGLDVFHQEFQCMDWEPGRVSLVLNGRSVPASHSPYTRPASVKAPFQLLETVEQLRAAELSGQIAVLGGELTREPLMPKNFCFWNPERHQEIVRLLEAKAPVAILTVSFSEERPVPIIEDGDFDIPSVVVAGKYLREFSASKGTVLTLRMEAERKPSRGANVIARQPGQGSRKAIVMAHFDTKPGTPGALDNAAGVTGLLLLSRLLQENPVPGGVELIAVNGEDYYSNPGQVAYLDTYQHTFDQLKLVINCDGPGYRVGKTGVSPMNCEKAFTKRIEKKLYAFPALKLSDPWYQGDHMIFAPYEVPTLAITSDEIFPIIDTVIHTEHDRMELVEAAYLEQVGRFIYEVLSEVQPCG